MIINKSLAAGVLVGSLFITNSVSSEPVLRVVATLPEYGVIAKWIGSDRVTVQSIVLGDQDAHFIRPKPSYVSMVIQADVLIDTGLDLELWIPAIVDKSGNTKVRSGQPGYVGVAQGLRLLEVPSVLSRSEGGLHIYGNPHITTSPINMKTVGRNIAHGLIKNDPQGKDVYLDNLERLYAEIDRRLFGERLVEILGGKTLCDLAEKDKLIPFLESNTFAGKPMIDQLGGWMKAMLPLRGIPVVTYHKNWVYFFSLFGLKEAETVEPKPGIPPSPKHVADLISQMKQQKVGILLAANYFDEHKVRTVAEAVGAEVVIVPLYVGSVAEVHDYFQLVDYWTESILKAARKAGLA